MNLNRIEALVSPKNIPSLKLITNMGFSQEGILKEHYNVDGILEDSLLFGLLKKNFQKI
jgi:ribosomal-protein-alanine N-acetyltransferase